MSDTFWMIAIIVGLFNEIKSGNTEKLSLFSPKQSSPKISIASLKVLPFSFPLATTDYQSL